MKNTKHSLIKIAAAAVCSVVFFYLCSISFFMPIIRNLFGSVNLPAMILSVLFFLILLFFLRNYEIKLPNHVITLVFYLASVFIVTSYFLESYIVAYDIYNKIEGEKPWLIAVEIIIVLCMLLYIIKKNRYKTKTENSGIFFSEKLIIYGIAAFLVGLSVYNHYTINFLYRDDYKNLHAYTNTIFNLFWGQPFTETITSVYGHYAFFYYPLMKLIYAFGYHNLLKNYMFLSMFQIFCMLIIWIIILCKNVKNTMIKVFGIFFICFFTSANCTPIYHQLNPHRTFPIAIAALMISLWYKAKVKRYITITGYMISIPTIIWNTEIGIIFLISWAALHICSMLQSNDKKTYPLIFLHFAAIPLLFLCSVLLCGGMNKLFGGKMISIKDFLFPLLSPSYMKDMLEHSLQPFPSAWMSIAVLLLVFLGYGLKDTILFSSNFKKSDQSAACFSISVLALGSLTYAINRPAFNSFFIIMPIAGLMLAIIADSFLQKCKYLFNTNKQKTAETLFKGYSALLSLSVLAVITVSTFFNIPFKLANSAPYKDKESIKDYLNYFDTAKDNKTIIIGYPYNFFYTYLGINPGFFYMDMTDLVVDKKFSDAIIESSKDYTDRFAITSTDVRYYYLSKEFIESHQITPVKIKDLKFFYFVPIE